LAVDKYGVGSWQKAVGKKQLAKTVGKKQLAVGNNLVIMLNNCQLLIAHCQLNVSCIINLTGP